MKRTTKHKPRATVVRLPRIAKGHKRAFVACRDCGRAYYYDYVPYSLSNPITWLDCGHGLGASQSERVTAITEKEARKRMAKWEAKQRGGK